MKKWQSGVVITLSALMLGAFSSQTVAVAAAPVCASGTCSQSPEWQYVHDYALRQRQPSSKATRKSSVRKAKVTRSAAQVRWIIPESSCASGNCGAVYQQWW
jgi:hypothetical protein